MFGSKSTGYVCRVGRDLGIDTSMSLSLLTFGARFLGGRVFNFIIVLLTSVKLLSLGLGVAMSLSPRSGSGSFGAASSEFLVSVPAG